MGVLDRLKEIKATIFFGNTMADEYMWKAIDEIERLREALLKISNSDTCGCQMECIEMCKIATDALEESV